VGGITSARAGFDNPSYEAPRSRKEGSGGPPRLLGRRPRWSAPGAGGRSRAVSTPRARSQPLALRRGALGAPLQAERRRRGRPKHRPTFAVDDADPRDYRSGGPPRQRAADRHVRHPSERPARRAPPPSCMSGTTSSAPWRLAGSAGKRRPRATGRSASTSCDPRGCAGWSSPAVPTALHGVPALETGRRWVSGLTRARCEDDSNFSSRGGPPSSPRSNRR
jgi:hypothetical protein